MTITKRFWTIPVITVYIYTITVLVNAGYTSYFDIPRYFVGASIKENILFAQMFFEIVWQMGRAIWFLLIILIPVALIAVFYAQRYISFIVMALLILFAFFGPTKLGNWIAEKQVTFLSPSENCEQFSDGKYAVVAAEDANFVMIKVGDDKKMEEGFRPISISELSCGMNYKDLGPIIK